MNAPTRNGSSAGYRFIRQLHLWIGAWGAIAAIGFGFSGLVLNHRFAMELPQGKREESAPVRIEVPATARTDIEAMAAWLQREHGMNALMKRNRPPGGPQKVGTGAAAEPEQWTLSGGGPNNGWALEYARGDASAELKRQRYSPLGALLRLHKSGGGGIGWILLGDSFALAMVLLGISGITMWARGRSLKQMAFSVLGVASVVTAAVLGAAALS